MPNIDQKSFDALVNDAITSDMTLVDAVEDVLESLRESGIDFSLVFIYKSSEELLVKNTTESKVKIIQRCASQEETFVNANFAFQTLAQYFSADNHQSYRREVIKMVVDLKLVVHLLKILANLNDYEAEESDEEEEDDIDIQIISTLTMLLLVLNKISIEFCDDPDKLLLIDTEMMFVFSSVLENNLTENKIIILTLECLVALLQRHNPNNIQTFKAAGGEEIVEQIRALAGKKNYAEMFDLSMCLATLISS